MRARDFVSEVGDSPYSFEPYTPPNQAHIKVRARNAIDKIPPNKTTPAVANPNIKNYSFVTKNGIRYVVILKPSEPAANGAINSVEVSFYAIDRRGRPNFDLTGTGDAANVFATVKNVLAKYIEEHDPRYIAFSSIKNISGSPTDDSRFKLYSLFAKNFGRWFPAYTKSWTKDAKDQIVFIFRRATDEPQVQEDLTRRGFLGGLGAAAVGIAGSQDQTANAANARTMARPAPVAQTLPVKQLKPLEKVLVATAQKAGLAGNELKQFLAQCAHETDNFTTLREIGNNNYFAKKYDKKYNPNTARNLGNTKPGDGIRYKGRGFIQLTGRFNYKKAGDALGIPLEQQPELAERPEVAAWIAVWYWIHRVKPNVSDFTNVKQSTLPINPGLKGLQSRQQHYNVYKGVSLPK